MRELNIEERLDKLEENITAIRGMLEKLLNIQPVSTVTENDLEIMSVKQLAQFMGLDVNIIYAKCANGDIPYFKLGKQYRFKKAEILKWVKGQKNNAQFSVDDYVEKYMQKHMLRM